ncbi:hypothetical protein GGF32_003384 [Allomyces javanicus]|nr:hypothetical protein GGF32_003384 [Allomyces javanicus]
MMRSSTTSARRRTRAAAALPGHFWQRTPPLDDALAVAAMERRLAGRLKRTERVAMLAVFAMPGVGPPGAVRRRVPPVPPTPRRMFQAQHQDDDDEEEEEDDDEGDSESETASDVGGGGAATRDGSFVTAHDHDDDDQDDDEYHDARSRHTTVDQTLAVPPAPRPPSHDETADLGGSTAVLPTGRTRILRTNRGARLTLEPDDTLAFLGMVGMQVDGPEVGNEEEGVRGPPTEFHAADNPFM